MKPKKLTQKMKLPAQVGGVMTLSDKKEARNKGIEANAKKNNLSTQDVALVLSMFDEFDKAPPKYKMIDGKIEFDSDDPTTFYAKIGAAIGIQSQAPKCHLVQQVGGLFAAEQSADTLNTGIALIDQIKPQTPLESLLAVQMIGCHNAAAEMMRRALLSEQTTDGVDANINRATKLMRTFTAQIEALSRLRGKGQQTVRVEHVTVHAGGQAIVGNVEHKTGGRGKDGN